MPNATVIAIELYMLMSLSAGVPLMRRGFRSLVSIPPAISPTLAMHRRSNIAININTTPTRLFLPENHFFFIQANRTS